MSFKLALLAPLALLSAQKKTVWWKNENERMRLDFKAYVQNLVYFE